MGAAMNDTDSSVAVFGTSALTASSQLFLSYLIGVLFCLNECCRQCYLRRPTATLTTGSQTLPPRPAWMW